MPLKYLPVLSSVRLRGWPRRSLDRPPSRSGLIGSGSAEVGISKLSGTLADDALAIDDELMIDSAAEVRWHHEVATHNMLGARFQRILDRLKRVSPICDTSLAALSTTIPGI